MTKNVIIIYLVKYFNEYCLFIRLYELKLSTFADIQWTSLVYCFDGATPEFLQQMFDSVLVTVDEKDIKTKSFSCEYEKIVF